MSILRQTPHRKPTDLAAIAMTAAVAATMAILLAPSFGLLLQSGIPTIARPLAAGLGVAAMAAILAAGRICLPPALRRRCAAALAAAALPLLPALVLAALALPVGAKGLALAALAHVPALAAAVQPLCAARPTDGPLLPDAGAATPAAPPTPHPVTPHSPTAPRAPPATRRPKISAEQQYTSIIDQAWAAVIGHTATYSTPGGWGFIDHPTTDPADVRINHYTDATGTYLLSQCATWIADKGNDTAPPLRIVQIYRATTAYRSNYARNCR